MPTKEHFIQSLQQELTPVTPLRSPRVRAALWSLVTLVFSVGVLLLTGPIRPGAFQQMLGVQFALETIIGFLPLWTASYVLFRLNIPGIEVSRGDVILAFAPMLMFLVFLIYGLYVAPALEPSMLGKRHHCVFEVLYVSLLPLVFFNLATEQGLLSVFTNPIHADGGSGIERTNGHDAAGLHVRTLSYSEISLWSCGNGCPVDGNIGAAVDEIV